MRVTNSDNLEVTHLFSTSLNFTYNHTHTHCYLYKCSHVSVIMTQVPVAREELSLSV